MASGRAAALLVFLSVFSTLSHAAEFTVGDSSGWTFQINYSQWAASKTFRVGDTLSFPFTSDHNVLEVSKADYDSCDASKAVQTYTTASPIKVTLNRAGEHWFICGIAGHCGAGMKLSVNVVAAEAATPAAAPAPAPTRSTRSRRAQTPVTSPSPSPSSSTRSPSPSPSTSPVAAPTPATSPSTGSPSPATSPSSSPPTSIAASPEDGTAPTQAPPSDLLPAAPAPPPSAAVLSSSFSWAATAAAGAGLIMFMF